MKPFVMPLATARYAHIHEPDEFEGTRHYKTELIIPAAEAEPLIEKLEELRDAEYEKAVENAKGQAKAKLKKYTPHPIAEPEVNDEGEETGNYIFKTKMAASFERNGRTVELRPEVVDARKRKFTGPVFGGSKIKVAVKPIPFQMGATKLYGVSLRMQAVQVIELSSGGGGAASMFDAEDGFDAEAEGYDETATDSPLPDDDHEDVVPDDDDEDF